MKRQNERTAVVDHEEAMERAVAELLFDARLELSAENGSDVKRQVRGQGADAEGQRRKEYL